jgi:glycosyltransferase involved in cell wall biosynthesis
VSVVVLTHNEARNLGACLDAVRGWAKDMYVVDSGSTDATLAIAADAGAVVASHPFETHAAQWAWALDHLPLATDWVLGLDADQQVTPELRRAVDAFLAAPGDARGAFVNRRQVFRGRWIRHGGYYPKYLLKLFRRDSVALDPLELVDHHFHVAGPTVQLQGDLIEDNRNEAEIAVWTEKHNRYAVLQARQELREAAVRPRVGLSALLGSPDARVAWRKQAWAGLPRFARPCLYVFYRYVMRLGFLDGKQGFVFHVLQGFWYRLLVDVNLDEIDPRQASAGEGQAEQSTP